MTEQVISKCWGTCRMASGKVTDCCAGDTDHTESTGLGGPWRVGAPSRGPRVEGLLEGWGHMPDVAGHTGCRWVGNICWGQQALEQDRLTKDGVSDPLRVNATLTPRVKGTEGTLLRQGRGPRQHTSHSVLIGSQQRGGERWLNNKRLSFSR